MNATFFFEMGRQRNGTALVPITNSTVFKFGFSTRIGNALVDRGDGSALVAYSPVKNYDFSLDPASNNVTFNYASAYSGNISFNFYNGLRDVYSIGFFKDFNSSPYNITNIESFFGQFSNLYSIGVKITSGGLAKTHIFSGDLAKLPNSVEKVLVSDMEILNTDLVLNFSSYTNSSRLKWIKADTLVVSSALKILGDLSKLPTSCEYIFLNKVLTGSSITYTAGKVWASAFDTLFIPESLTHTENNALLADMDGSISTSTGSGKVIQNTGYRTSASDTYVASLVSKGFTVNIPKYSITPQKILDLSFQNNLTDSTGLNTMVAGATSNQPTFALSGRKAGEYCAVFNGSQSIKTSANLQINSDKVTIAFWMKTTQTTSGFINELSTSVDANNAFLMNINNTGQANKIQSWSKNQNYNNITNPTTINDGVWRHFVAVIDRMQNAINEIKFYENGILMSVTKQFSNDNSGNFLNNILYIGQRAGNSLGFVGSLMYEKVYNYPLTQAEITNLYNSEL